jgi:hypothetical protein
MDIHSVIYIGLGLAYCDAARCSAAEGNLHCAIREAVIALLYIAIPIFVLDPDAVLAPVGAVFLT